MSLTLLLYLVEIVNSISNLSYLFTGGYILLVIIFSFMCLLTKNDEYEKDKYKTASDTLSKICKKSWIFFICLSLQIIIPDKNAMYMMLGSKYLTDSNIPSKVSEILDLKLNNILTDLKKTKEK